MDRGEILKALVDNHGSVKVLKHYASEAQSAMNSMRIGISEGNQMLATKDFEALYDAVRNIKVLIDDKDNAGALTTAVKNNIKS